MTSTIDTTAERRSGNNALAAALVCLVTVVAFETMSVATIMPKVLADIGGLGLYGWAFSGLALGEVMGIVIAGTWTDRVNPVRPILVGLVVYSIGLVISGLANDMLVVVIGRVLQGYGSGTVPAVAYVCVGRGFAEAERPRVFAWMSTAWVVPSMIGPSAAGVLEKHVGWRAVFLGLIPVVICVGALAIRPIARLGNPVAGATPTPDDGAVGSPARTVRLATVAVLGTGLALGAFQLRNVVALSGLFVLGAVTLVWAFRRIAPAGTLRLARGVPSTVAVRGMLTFAFLGADAYVSLALQDVKGMSATSAGIVLSSAALTWTAGSWYSAKRITRVGPRRLVTAGLAAVVVGIAAMVLVVNSSVNSWWAIGAWLVGGLGIGLAYAPLTQAVISAADPAQLGAATSALQLSDVLGFALGTGLGGAIIALADRHGATVDGSSVHAGVLLVFGVTAAVGAVGVASARRMHRYLGGDEPPTADATAAANAAGAATSSS
ncbi:MAG TPA: MFS transporter [Microthrixaceae bacterium]|nr:MFS transporter [Microthrixaceae bacterium]